MKLLSRVSEYSVSIHLQPECEWDKFNSLMASLGYKCRYGLYDMICLEKKIQVPKYEGMSVCELTVDDMPLFVNSGRKAVVPITMYVV